MRRKEKKNPTSIPEKKGKREEATILQRGIRGNRIHPFEGGKKEKSPSKKKKGK